MVRDADVGPPQLNGWTAVMSPCIRALVHHQAHVGAACKDGSMALRIASDGGHVFCIEVLIERKADVQATNIGGSTALIMASHFGHLACARAHQPQLSRAVPVGGVR